MSQLVYYLLNMNDISIHNKLMFRVCKLIFCQLIYIYIFNIIQYKFINRQYRYIQCITSLSLKIIIIIINIDH